MNTLLFLEILNPTIDIRLIVMLVGIVDEYIRTRSNQVIAAGCHLKMLADKILTSQYQLNDIINVSRDGVEVKGDTITSLCEVDTFVGATDGGRLDFVVASRDEEAGVHTV